MARIAQRNTHIVEHIVDTEFTYLSNYQQSVSFSNHSSSNNEE